jgi:WD40-like Beta Propeller Repeat
MTDYRTVLERDLARVGPAPFGFDDVARRRDRKRRNQRIAAGVVGIAVFVAAIWIVTSGGWFDRTQQPAIQPTRTPEPSLIAPGTYLIDLNTSEMTPLPKSIAGNVNSIFPSGYSVSPDGTMVAYTSPDDAGTYQVFIASLNGTDVQQVTHDRRGAAAPDWSPDGAAIVFNDQGDGVGQGDVSNIFVLDLATGETSQVTNVKAPIHADAPEFSPDGASIVYDLHPSSPSSLPSSSASVRLRIVPVTGGKSVLLVGGAALGTFSPDGSTLAMACSDGICIADAQGTNLRTLVSGPSLTDPRWSPDGTRIAYTDQADSSDPKVFMVDVATGETTFVAEGVADDWLDDNTLIVYHPG